MTEPLKVTLSIEEALEYQKFEEQAKGYMEGIRQATDHFRRLKLQELIASRSKKTTPENQNI